MQINMDVIKFPYVFHLIRINFIVSIEVQTKDMSESINYYQLVMYN